MIKRLPPGTIVIGRDIEDDTPPPGLHDMCRFFTGKMGVIEVPRLLVNETEFDRKGVTLPRSA